VIENSLNFVKFPNLRDFSSESEKCEILRNIIGKLFAYRKNLSSNELYRVDACEVFTSYSGSLRCDREGWWDR